MSNSRLIICILLFWSFTQAFPQNKALSFSILLNNNEPITIHTAPLKYDKDFALSLTFDDGLLDAYQQAFPLLSGGTSAVDGVQYPGLFYSDGCGQLIPFSASVAWYTVNAYGDDIHTGNNDLHYSWSQANELIHGGWEFMNHSFDHSANVFGIDYNRQLEDNRLYFYNKTGTDMRYVIPPSGDPDYIQPAFDAGYLAVFTSNSAFTTSGGQALRVDDNVSSGRPVFWRRLLNSDTDNLHDFISHADSIIALTNQNNHLWWNEFTHRVQYDVYPASIRFTDLKDYLNHLEEEYGYQGQDNGLFANSAEVFEYLSVRDNIQITVNQMGDRAEITLDYSACPTDLSYYDISLIMQGSTPQRIDNQEETTIDFAVQTDGSTLINVHPPKSYFSGVSDTPNPFDSIEIFPNPSTGLLNIAGDRPFPANTRIFLYSVSGSMLEPQIISVGRQLWQVNLSALHVPDGLYILKAIANGEILFAEKILIQK